MQLDFSEDDWISNIMKFNVLLQKMFYIKHFNNTLIFLLFNKPSNSRNLRSGQNNLMYELYCRK